VVEFSIARWEDFVIGNSERLNGEKNGRMPQFFSPFRVQSAATMAAANVRLNCHYETPTTVPIEKKPSTNDRLNYRI